MLLLNKQLNKRPLSLGHPFFVALQAHPEFCSRPLNPSPPFLGFVAAACGEQELVDQISNQLKTFTPPHPVDAMVDEAEIIASQGLPDGKGLTTNGINTPRSGASTP